MHLTRLNARNLIAAAAIGFGLFSLAAPTAQASTVAHLAPEKVLGTADSIFEGVVETSRSYYRDGDHGPILTDYTVAVTQTLRDESGELARRARAGRVVLTFSGGRVADVEDIVHGVPKLTVGEKSFFFINKRDWEANSPIVGMFQGLFRVQTVDGREQVVRAGGCCESPAPVTSHFFAKTTTAPEGFSRAEFIDEIARALPIAREKPELSPDAAPQPLDRLPDSAFDARSLGVATSGGPAPRGPRSGAEPIAAPLAAAAPRLPAPPVPANPVMVDQAGDANDTVLSPLVNRYGYFSNSPTFPVTFNIAPNMNGFAGVMENMLAYWNQHADIFRIYTNPTSTFNFGNGRNEAGFATSGTLNAQQGRNWNTNEYAVCYSRSQSGRIIESDIYFNLDPGMTWTTDVGTAAAQSLATPCSSGTCGLVLLFNSVCIHETGHSFGLEHQYITNPRARFPSVMNYYPINRLYDTGQIFADDANGARNSYGAQARTNGLIKLWYNDGNIGTNSNFTQWTIGSGVSVQRGSSLAVGGGSSYFTIDNTGTTFISPRVDFYLTPAFGSWDNAIYLGTANPASISPGGSAQYQRSVTVPSGVTPGQYYVGAFMTVAGDQDGSDNSAWSYNRVTVTAAAPSNDSRFAATAISSRGGSYSGTTFGATYDFGGACGSSVGSPDVWYSITPAYAGALEVSTCGSGYDTVLELFDSSFTSLICNDDATYGACANTYQSRLSRNVSAGVTYYIRVSGYNRATGNFALDAHLYPANDGCVANPRFGGYSASINTGQIAFGTTVGATPTPAGAIPAAPMPTARGSVNVEGRNDVWFGWTAGCSSPVVISTASTRTQHIAVYSRCFETAIFPPTLVANGVLRAGYANPVAAFTPEAGRTYAIRVITGDVDADFAILADQGGAPNDTCATAEAVTVSADAPASVVADTRCASPSDAGFAPPACGDAAGGFDPGSDVFYSVTIGTTGTLQVTRCNGTYLPVVALYPACPSADQPVEALTCGYSDSGSCDPVIIAYPVTAGETYIMRVAGNPAAAAGAAGVSTITLTITPAATGACCQIDGTCSTVAAGDCGGVYNGDDTVCDPSPCEQPSGACCLGSACSVMTGADCSNAGGVYAGDGEPCTGGAGNPITCCTANFNGEGGVTVQDIFDYLAAYFTLDPRADVNASGEVTVQDIFDFLTQYFAGC